MAMYKNFKLTNEERAQILEQHSSYGYRQPLNEQPTGENKVVSCSSLGIKTIGYCDVQLKKPVKPCAELGVKTIGYCYVDTKKPVSGIKKEPINEQDLVRLVNRVIKEQANPVAQTGYVRNPRGYTKPTQNNTQFVSCSSLGIKSPGYCDSKTKRPVAPCSQFGVKTPGYCFMDNKQPVPNSGVVKEKLIQTPPRKWGFFIWVY